MTVHSNMFLKVVAMNCVTVMYKNFLLPSLPLQIEAINNELHHEKLGFVSLICACMNNKGAFIVCLPRKHLKN